MVPDFRPTGSLVTALTVLLVAILVLGVGSSAMGLATGLFFPEAAVEDEPESFGASLALIGGACHALIYTLVYFTTSVLFCVFVHRSNHNARALGSENMEYTPGWAVGWFFIPIANLFRPYRAVSEIYLASEPEAGPRDWYRYPVPSLLPWWWCLWIVANVFGMFTARAALSNSRSFRAWTPWLEVVDGLLEVPLSLLALAVVRSIHRRQTEKTGRALAPVA